MTTAPDENILFFSTLSILQLIKEAHQQHGLRHADYQRYRGYCARRLRRLRKSLHCTYVHKQRGGGSFHAKKVTADQIKDIRYLLLEVFNAERCWAYYVELKQELNSDRRKKFHMLRRLKKAVRHGQLLEKLALTLDAVDAKTKLEAQAYAAWLTGSLHMECQRWKEALESFTKSKTIYEKLASASPDDRHLYEQRCTEMAPQLRYCQYNIGDDSAISDIMQMRLNLDDANTAGMAGSDLDALIAQATERAAKALKYDLQWCNHKIGLEKPAKVKSFYTELVAFDERVDSVESVDTKMGMYERLVIECRDALQAIRDDAKDNFNSEFGEEDNLSLAQLQHAFLNYIKIMKTTERYLMLIDNAWNQWTQGELKRGGKPQDLVRLFDTVLQNIAEMEHIPGTRNDPTFGQSLTIQGLYYKAFRAYFLGEAMLSVSKWPEAIALSDRALAYAGDAERGLDAFRLSSEFEKKHLSVDRLNELKDRISGMKSAAYANAITEDQISSGGGDEISTLKKQTPLDSDLSKFYHIKPDDLVKNTKTGSKGIQLTSFPPDFVPIPAKPLFFDLALNYIQFPSLEDKIEVEKPAVKPAPAEAGAADTQGGGITGLVKGLFWGKK